jgi:hypothetical protein
LLLSVYCAEAVLRYSVAPYMAVSEPTTSYYQDL